MYMVVSTWEVLPGKEAEFEERSRPVRAAHRAQPGVKLIEGFKSNGRLVAVHGYESEADYQRLVQDPEGPFQKALADSGLEEVGRWISSERGETID